MVYFMSTDGNEEVMWQFGKIKAIVINWSSHTIDNFLSHFLSQFEFFIVTMNTQFIEVHGLIVWFDAV